MADMFDEEGDFMLSQVDLSENLFDLESDILLSQLDIDTIIDKEDLQNYKFSQIISSDSDTSSARFDLISSCSEIDALRKSSIPQNTEKNTSWGVSCWDTWGKWRNDTILKDGLKESVPYTLVPPLSNELTAHEFNYWICRFIVEVRRQDGDEYPAESVRLLCVAIWRYIRDTCRRYDLNMFEKTNVEFAEARECLDGRMKKLQASMCREKKQAEPISLQEESILWDLAFSKNEAKYLQYAVYFYACKLFGLRATDEHSDLKVEQFKFGKDEEGDYIMFQGGKSKNAQGGLFHAKVAPKCIKHYSSKDTTRCPVVLFKKYIDLIPQSGPFYRRPLACGKDGSLRFSIQKVGMHTIRQFMQAMCAAAGVEGYKTGHSGKVTTATTLYQDGFDEQLIAERTGHRSNAIRAYKRTSNRQVKAISEALQPPTSTESSKNPSTEKSFVSETATDSAPVSEINIDKRGVKINIKF